MRMLIGLWFACLVSGVATPARAQEHVGNAMNSDVIGRQAPTDPDGMGITEHPRTPTGHLHVAPRVVEPAHELPGGWLARVSVEFGALGVGGDTSSAAFREYKDVSSGAYLNRFRLSFEKPDSASYVRAYGGAPGRNDQFFGAEAGRYNTWRLRGTYHDVPHVFTSTYRSLWTGYGTDTLRLTGLTPGGTVSAAATQAAIVEALASTPESDVALTRHRAATRFDVRLPWRVNAFASYSREHREGARPFGMVFGGGGGGGNIDVPESVNAVTTDVTTGLHWVRRDTQVNLLGAVSHFRSDVDTLTIENPLFVTLNTITGVPATAFTAARFDMHPGNTAYNARVDAAHRLPSFAGSRLSGVFSVSRYRQDDALMPWTTLPLTGGAINGVPTDGMWNTTAALTRTMAGARLDTTLVDLGWAVKPVQALDVRLKWRYYDTDNATDFVACNPLTGQWGRLTNDGSGGSFVTPNTAAGNNPAGTLATAYYQAGCSQAAVTALALVPSAGNIVLRNVPFAYRQLNTSVTAAYRFNRHYSVEGMFERESFDREYREREDTWEDRAKVTWVARGFAAGTFRASYGYGRRRGTEYIVDPYEHFLSASLGPTPTAIGTNMGSWFHAVDQLRKFDLADRDRHTADARFTTTLAPGLDASVAVVFRDQLFPTSSFGRTDRERQLGPNVDLTWQPADATSISGFASLQRGRMQQAAIHPLGCVLGNSYYFYSDGSVQTNATGQAPAPPAGTSLVASQLVMASNWSQLCGQASATSPLFPLSRTWSAAHRDRQVVTGATAYHDGGRYVVNVSYTYGRHRTAIDYDYNPAALGMTDVQVALAGSGWPALAFDQHNLDSDVTVPVKPGVGLRFVYRYEHGRVRDWHYDGVDINPMPAANALYLDAGRRGYGVHLVGAFLRLELR